MSNSKVTRHVGVLSGDGIGPEVVAEAVRVLELVSDKYELGLSFAEGLLGGCAIETRGTPLPPETVELCKRSDALLVGAVGGPKWDQLPAEMNPGPGGLLKIRKDFDAFANLRPGVSYLPDQLRVGKEHVDILMVRESVGGAYFSSNRGRTTGPDGVTAFDTMEYTETQIRRIVRMAAELAVSRGGRLASVDKANVLESSRLWREIATDTLLAFPQLQVEHLYVDNCAMQLVLRPSQFDVIVTENLFGDILSDEIAGVIGSLGLLPSGSLRGDGWGLYEPVHGSAPEMAGTGRANPVATILSAAMLLRYSFGLSDEATLIEEVCTRAMREGLRTADIAKDGEVSLSTSQFGAAICEEIANLSRLKPELHR